MKHVVVIPDGFADDPLPIFNNQTPMQAAATPNLDALAPTAALGCSRNVPDALSPGSDVATLGLLGYDPLECYTGRAPLEVAAQGIDFGPNDWAFRCNLVCLENREIMQSFTAGHISTAEATAILAELQRDVAPLWGEIAPEIGGSIAFYPGVSYRNLLIWRPDADAAGEAPFDETTRTVPPHDYSDRSIADVWPQGRGGAAIRRLMDRCAEKMRDMETNRARVAAGKLPATDCWLWGQGKRPTLAPYAEKYGVGKGAMITAVDLLRGIARDIGWDVLDVPGATGYVDTNYAGKGEAAARALDEYDVVCVHIEAPDEMGHEGCAERKKFAMERIDAETLPPILAKLREFENWRLLISPDHPTPVATKTHSRGFVPWAIFGSDIRGDGFASYDEATAAASGRTFPRGWELAEKFLRGRFD
ncbi:MAG: cofactor-independent phosphoglycerate mutase [Thermoguttaceae bacterium]|nr:cofactor-independent phosphoglycerate mutase [Thermoguttaceae bacterium]